MPADGSRLWELDETMHARVRQPLHPQKGRGQAKKVEVPMPIDGEEEGEPDWREGSKCERFLGTSASPDWDALSVGQGYCLLSVPCLVHVIPRVGSGWLTRSSRAEALCVCICV